MNDSVEIYDKIKKYEKNSESENKGRIQKFGVFRS